MKILIPLLAAVIGAAALVVLYKTGQHPDLPLIQDGTAVLSCEFYDGWRDVPAHKVVDFDADHGRWIFTNGSVSAANCWVHLRSEVLDED